MLVRILNQPLRKAPTFSESKWDCVTFDQINFAQPGEFPLETNDETFCSQDDILVFASALARRAPNLAVRESPEILECLSRAPQQTEMETLSLDRWVLSGLECERLGSVIQRSLHLKHLDLYLNHLEEPQALVESLANAIHLQELSISDMNRPNFWSPQRGQSLSDLIVKERGENDIVLRLLHNSRNRLLKLSLANMHLEDGHFMAIVELLPNTHLEVLNLSENNIQREGILRFAAQLPRIKCLKVVHLGLNPWEDLQESVEDCWVALLQGVLANSHIEYVGAKDSSPLAKIVRFYCNLNRSGRRLLATPIAVPLGLWPFLLERSAKDTYHVDDWTLDFDLIVGKYRAESLYYFLQNSPILSFISSSSFLKNPEESRSVRKIKIMLWRWSLTVKQNRSVAIVFGCGNHKWAQLWITSDVLMQVDDDSDPVRLFMHFHVERHAPIYVACFADIF